MNANEKRQIFTIFEKKDVFIRAMPLEKPRSDKE